MGNLIILSRPLTVAGGKVIFLKEGSLEVIQGAAEEVAMVLSDPGIKPETYFQYPSENVIVMSTKNAKPDHNWCRHFCQGNKRANPTKAKV